MAGPSSASAIAISLLVVLLPPTARPFNLDTEQYSSFRGENDSYFGFSVALHRERGQSWVLVGAPKAQTRQPNVTKGGAVYACDINVGDCSEKVFDASGHNHVKGAQGGLGQQIDEKNNQWFGASVYSAGENGPVVACAPRYIFYSTLGNPRREPVGTCFFARNEFKDIAEYAPCRNREWGYHRQGFCQAGFGVAISRDGDRLFIGAVGSRYWQGQLYSINDHVKFPYVPLEIFTNDHEGKLISQNTHSRPDMLSTPEQSYLEDDTYMGYSITVGDFGGSVPGHEDVAVGRPKGEKLNGEVLIFTWNLTSIQKITGEQLGSYFGYSLATSDVDGDGSDDLIIGAPFYTDMTNNEENYETGRVYILYQKTGRIRFNHVHVKDGKKSKGRFGLALTTLGDINKDGYGDFAVGAPYDGPDERGAVYLFHGGVEGVRDTYSQVIYAEDIVGSPSTFGFSLSGGRDLDENDYPDLVVGAYDANAAVFLRARPVVKVDASINFLSEGKQIALEERNCTLPDSTKVPCLQLNSCLKYHGVGVGSKLDFDVQYVLDTKKQKSPRLFFMSGGKSVLNKSLRLIKGEETCERMLIYLKPNIRDKLTLLDAEINYSLIKSASLVRRQLSPILDLDEELSRKDSISIRKNCGKDNICIPDLRLIAQPSVKRYLLGSGLRFNLSILIENEGEDAFEASFETSIPPGMNYVKIERIDDREKEIPVQCSPPTFSNNYTLHCDIGNPLPREKLVEFKVVLQPFHQDGMKPRYEFEMRVNSTNPENSMTVSDNHQRITVPIWVETDLILQGSSHPADVHYNSSLYYKTNNFTHESEIGPQVIHVYGIRNKGPSDIEEAEAYFLWPSYTLAGDHLLYLLEQPEIAGNIRCEHVEEANVEHFILDRKKKSFLDHRGEAGVQAGLASSSHSESSESSATFSHSSSGVGVHESHSSSSSSSFSSGRVLTIEENKKLEEAWRKREEEEALKETGDGSNRHQQRIGSHFKEIHYSSNGGRLESDSHSKSVNSNERGGIGGIPVVSDRSYHEQRGQVSHSGSKQSGSSFRSGSAGGGGGHVHYEEKEETSKTTWSSGQTPQTVTSTKWKTIDDGAEKSGSSSNIQSGTTISLANLGLSSYGNKRYTLVGSGSGSGRTYTEERHYEKNSTWNSREGTPKVSESSSWRTNEDGIIKSGSSRSSSLDGHRTTGVVASEYDSRAKTPGSTSLTNEGSTRHDSSSSHHEHDSRATASGSTSGTFQGSTGHDSSASHHEYDSRATASGSTSGTHQGSTRHDSSASHREYDSRATASGSTSGTYQGSTRQDSSGSHHEYETGNRQSSSSGRENSHSHHIQSQGGQNTRAYEERVSQGGIRGNSQNWNSGRDTDRFGYSNERQHVSTGTHGSEHRTFSGTSNTDDYNYDRAGTSHSHNRHTAESQNNDRVQGLAHRGTAYDERTTHSESGGRRNEGKHKIHWSSEHSGGGLGIETDNADHHRGSVNIEEDIRRVAGSSEGSYGQGSGHGQRTYTEEHNREWNTTWNSADGGKPRTTEVRKWSVNEDGTFKNGSFRDSYDGTAKLDKDLNKHLIVSNVGSGDFNLDPNLVRTGTTGKVYSEEKETIYNTTWSSATGGLPITRQQTNWKVNKDGVITSGSKSDTFEGTPSAPHMPDQNSHSSSLQGSRRQEFGYENRQGYGRQGSGVNTYNQQSESHKERQISGAHISGGHISGDHSIHQHGSAQAGSHHHSASSGASTSENRRYEENAGSYGIEHENHGRTHQAGTTNVGDLLRGSQSSSGQASSFNHFGEIARGPKNGVAKTYTLDLGMNSRNNDESNGSMHRGHSTSSSSGGSESRGRHYSLDNPSSSSRNEESRGFSYRNQDRLEGGGSAMHSTWSHSASEHSSADGDNPQHGGAYGMRTVSETTSHRHISDDSNRGKFQFYPRYKRQAGEEDFEKSLSCGPTDCITIKCTLGPLKKDEEAWVAFRSRVWVPTIKKLSTNVEVGLSSLVVARVTRLPHIGSPDVVTKHSYEVHSQVMPPESAVKPDIIPLWIVVVSACAGAIILMLLVYLLYKCGFFKRNRPSNAPEKQPLNRNGYHHGDEAL